MEEREANLAKLRADRAKNDRMSDRELFMSDSSWFVDDVGAYDKHEREEESDEPKRYRVKRRVERRRSRQGRKAWISGHCQKGQFQISGVGDPGDGEIDGDVTYRIGAGWSKGGLHQESSVTRKCHRNSRGSFIELWLDLPCCIWRSVGR